jgi:hypothetical protein
VAGVATERAGSTESATGTRAFFAGDFARRGFPVVFFPRAPLLAPAFGNTSIVQRTLRPARSGRVRFATATGHRKARAGPFSAGVQRFRAALLQIGEGTFNSVAVIS